MKQSQNTVVQVPHPRCSRMNTVVNYLLAIASPVLQAIYSPLHQYYYIFGRQCYSPVFAQAGTNCCLASRNPSFLPSLTQNIHNIHKKIHKKIHKTLQASFELKLNHYFLKYNTIFASSGPVPPVSSLLS